MAKSTAMREVKMAHCYSLSGDSESAFNHLISLLEQGCIQALPGALLLLAFKKDWLKLQSLCSLFAEEFLRFFEKQKPNAALLWSVETYTKLAIIACIQQNKEFELLKSQFNSFQVSENTKKILFKHLENQDWVLERRFPVFDEPYDNTEKLEEVEEDNALSASIDELLKQKRVMQAIHVFEQRNSAISDMDLVATLAACYQLVGQSDTAKQLLCSSVSEFWPTCLFELAPAQFVTQPLLIPLLNQSVVDVLLNTPRAWAIERNKMIDRWNNSIVNGALKKDQITISISSTEITEPVTKFGGQPVWLGPPQWPISRSTGNQLHFLGQILLDEELFGNSSKLMAYIFLANDLSENWEPDGGENAIVLQKLDSQLDDDNFKCVEAQSGPTFSSDCKVSSGITEETFFDSFIDEIPVFDAKIGGFPDWLQGPPVMYSDWDLLLQLPDSALPFDVNFGLGGIAYAMLSKDRKVAKFLFQC